MHIPFPVIHTLLTSHWLPVTEAPKSLEHISPAVVVTLTTPRLVSSPRPWQWVPFPNWVHSVLFWWVQWPHFRYCAKWKWSKGSTTPTPGDHRRRGGLLYTTHPVCSTPWRASRCSQVGLIGNSQLWSWKVHCLPRPGWGTRGNSFGSTTAGCCHVEMKGWFCQSIWFFKKR